MYGVFDRCALSGHPAWRWLATGWLLWLAGCGSVGIEPDAMRLSADKPFDQALISYATGDHNQAQVFALQALESNPLDLRATDLLRAILKEKGLVDEFNRSVDPALPVFDPKTPEEMVRIISGRNPAIRGAVFGVIEGRAALRESEPRRRSRAHSGDAVLPTRDTRTLESITLRRLVGA